MNNSNLVDRESSVGNDLPESEIEAIAREYEKSIYIPGKKNKRQIFLAPVGLVAAGKSTVLDLLCERLSLARVSGDDIRLLLRDKGYNYLKTLDIANLVLLGLLDQGYSIAVDSDCISIDVRKAIQAYKEKYSFQDIWIHINPPEKFIEDKLSKMKYEKSGIFSNKEEALANFYERMPLHKEYVSKIKYLYEFDTSRDDIREQAEEFIALLEKPIISNHYLSSF